MSKLPSKVHTCSDHNIICFKVWCICI
jgi:hypothetical protein